MNRELVDAFLQQVANGLSREISSGFLTRFRPCDLNGNVDALGAYAAFADSGMQQAISALRVYQLSDDARRKICAAAEERTIELVYAAVGEESRVMSALYRLIDRNTRLTPTEAAWEIGMAIRDGTFLKQLTVLTEIEP